MSWKATLATAAALLIAGAAHAASADTVKTTAQNNFAGEIDPTGPWTVTPDHKTLLFGGSGRWGLKLDMEQPLGRDIAWKDAVSYTHLTLPTILRV